MSRRPLLTAIALLITSGPVLPAEAPRPPESTQWWKPYSPPCTERENVFEFTEKPSVKKVGKDRYEIAFAVKGYCDVTADLVAVSTAD